MRVTEPLGSLARQGVCPLVPGGASVALDPDDVGCLAQWVLASDVKNPLIQTTSY